MHLHPSASRVNHSFAMLMSCFPGLPCFAGLLALPSSLSAPNRISAPADFFGLLLFGPGDAALETPAGLGAAAAEVFFALFGAALFTAGPELDAVPVLLTVVVVVFFPLLPATGSGEPCVNFTMVLPLPRGCLVSVASSTGTPASCRRFRPIMSGGMATLASGPGKGGLGHTIVSVLEGWSASTIGDGLGFTPFLGAAFLFLAGAAFWGFALVVDFAAAGFLVAVVGLDFLAGLVTLLPVVLGLVTLKVG